MFMDIYLTAKPKNVNKNIVYLKNNVEVISQIINVVPYAKSNTDVLLNKRELKRMINNLKEKKDKLLSIARNKYQDETLEQTIEGIDNLQLIFDTFDFDKFFLYIYYE